MNSEGFVWTAVIVGSLCMAWSLSSIYTSISMRVSPLAVPSL